jgi:ABC-type polysaccharide/polyol phosphate transport system ATPase subunit
MPAVEFIDVTKRYTKLHDQAMLVKSIMPFHRTGREDLLALRNINFSIDAGETVGIVGRNGAGKSTMLRLLAGVTAPTSGVVRVSGRVAPLLGVGVGFHQEMSGRENVYVNAMLLGLSRKETAERFDDIVEFSEIGDFIDTPVKFYSSGMYMRLGFAVAVHSSPQIMLVDEILAVGDGVFQLKCFDRLRELQQRGTTIVMVSHNLHALRLLCPRLMLIRKGVLEFDGDPEMAISRHQHFMNLDSTEDHMPQLGMPVTVLGHRVERDGVPVSAASQSDMVTATWTVRFEQPTESPQALFRILAEDGTLAYSLHTTFGTPWRDFAAGETTDISVTFQPRFGGGGTFRLLLDVLTNDGVRTLGSDMESAKFFVSTRLATTGLGDADARISIAGQTLSDWPDLAFIPPDV